MYFIVVPYSVRVDLTITDNFCGAVRNLANYLCNRYGKRNVCFILPLHRYDEDNPRGEFGSQTKLRPSLKEYVKAEIAVLDDMDVRYLDFRNAFPLPVTNTPTEYFQDGLHPTNKGHELLAAAIMEGATAEALESFVDYVENLKDIVNDMGEEAKGMCLAFLSEVDEADSYLY